MPGLTSTEATPYDYRTYWPKLHRQHPGSLCAVGYPALGKGFNQVTYRLRLAAVRRLLNRHQWLVPHRLLEAGVGVGAYGPLWQELGVKEWVGVDLSLEAVEWCRQQFGWGSFFAADIASQEFAGLLAEGKPFDLVIAIDVLYHLTSEVLFERAVENLKSAIGDQGVLLVSDVFAGAGGWTAPHVKRRPLEAYQRVLGEAFILLDQEPVFGLLNDPAPADLDSLVRLRTVFWKGLCRLLLSLPSEQRDWWGGGIAQALVPLDNLFRRMQKGRGTTLELALFVRRPMVGTKGRR